MNNINNLLNRMTAALALGIVVFFAPQAAVAEGSVQMGLNQPLADYEASLAQFAINADSASQFVDILAVGEVINVSLCGQVDADNISVEIFNPSGTSVFTASDTSGNVACNDPMSAPLTGGFEYVTAATGPHRIVLQNTDKTGYANSFFRRYDITVTPDTATDPDPTVAAGRLYAYSWNMNAGSFASTAATDANLFALVPGGRPDTNYVWRLDLNQMAGYYYNIIANAVGVTNLTNPSSGFSTETGNGNAAVYLYSVYLGVPEIAFPQPTVPPQVSDVRFIDDAGQDNGISPGNIDGVQDSGTFEFTSDVPGTYAVFVDVNQNTIFGDPGDVFLLGLAIADVNSVAWDGKDPNGDILPAGSYNAKVSVRLGEYHFVAQDIETSGGGVQNGLTIFLSDLAGNLSDTLVYWDDITILGAAAGGTSTRPQGTSSGVPEGRHTWGNYSASGFGNERYIDTYVYGLATDTSAAVVITTDDAPLTGVDGTVSVDPFIARNDTLNITVSDPDLNTGSTAIEQVIVTLTNDVTGEFEQVVLTETGANTGVFTGTLPTTFGTTAGANNSGNMNAQEGDTITASYDDQLDSTGGSATRTASSTVAVDSDADGVVDPIDSDDDNDGIPDASEAAGDADSDGLVNSLDIDSDGDGIPDNVEAQPSDDYRAPSGSDDDSDGLDNEYDADFITGVPIVIVNSDALVPDYLDTDSDNDGVLDAVEGHDGNSDGVADRGPAGLDDDNDGLDNAYDTIALPVAGNPNGSNADLQDTDGDAVPDWRDVDDDNDGVDTATENPAIDTDGDSIPDYLESSDDDSDGDGTNDQLDPENANPCVPNPLVSGCTEDTDGDGISNSDELANGTDPSDPDTDNDGLSDGEEVGANGIQDIGETSALDADSDDDGLSDGVEVNGSGPLSTYGATDPLNDDTDGDTLSDGLEVGETAGVNAGNSDGNGTAYTGTDGGFTGDADPTSTTNPLDADTDADGLDDNIEDANGDGQTVNTIGNSTDSGTGETDPDVADTDGDGLSDGDEVNATGPLLTIGATDPLDTDTDDGGTQDGTEVLADGTDPRFGFGADDFGGDPDDDGLSTEQEAALGTDPADADSDNDGIDDGDELGNDASFDIGDTNPLDADTDDDGLSDGTEQLGLDGIASSGDELDPLVADSDNDGILDGTEAQVTNGVSGGLTDGNSIPYDGTDTASTNFVADADPSSGTNPAVADTDGDGLDDGAEDANGDGATVNTIGGTNSPASSGETDPNNTDTDGDGLSDGDERNGTGPLGIWGVTDPLDTDTDDGGVQDGTEISDGTDPTDGSDDVQADADNDGLSDNQEAALGTDPNDADSDNDGLSDSEEVGIDGEIGLGDSDPLDSDTDDDGLSDGAETLGADGVLNSGDETSPISADTDSDGLSDGLEQGVTVALSGGVSDGNSISYDGTDTASPNFVIDTHPSSTTDPTDDDTDNDGLSDGAEDANGDGAASFTLGGTGTSGSGETDPNDADTDDDLLSDGNEVNATGVLSGIGSTDPLDTDTDDGSVFDGIEVLNDFTDPNDGGDDLTDSDGDGISDGVETGAGTDPDDPCDPNFPGQGCLDSDNDGAADFGTPTSSVPVEPNVAANDDPCVPDNTVSACDSDGDGISDGDEIAAGTDPDDVDSDDDGIPDNQETGDTDGDGIIDALDTDSDNDGNPDSDEAGDNPEMPVDTDGDGTPDYQDSDSDDDGVPDSVEGSGDADGDGLANYQDDDADNDGIPDAVEDGNLATADTDNDDIDDAYDVDVTGGTDSNLDGVDDSVMPIDTDGDGSPDFLDIDSDNDGIPDTLEADLDPAADGDGDGINDVYDVTVTLGTDADNNGVDDNVLPTDTDGDGVPDYRDLDSDNDSLWDVGESGGIDANGDAIIDDPATNDGSTTQPADTDGDTVPNHRDLDSDDDGSNDIVGNIGEAFDTDGDGVIDDPTDSDGDGIADVVDLSDQFGTIADADLDGIPDGVEGSGDMDGDEIPNFLDTDSDGDGIPDATEAGPDPLNPVDTDGDGMPDYLDTDSDNDGIPDSVDSGDKDGDGIPDRIDADEGQLRTAVSGIGSIGGAEVLMLLLVLMGFAALRARRGVTLAALLCCLTLPFVADEPAYADGNVCGYSGAKFNGCWYAGVGLGATHVAPEGRAGGWSTNDDKDSGWKVYGGYQFKPLWSVELAYVDGGEAGLGNVDPALEALIPDAAIDYSTPSIMVVRWLNEKDSPFNAFLRLGASAISNSASDSRIPYEKQTSVQLAGGIGAQYTFAERWFLRGDVDLYDRDHYYYGLSIGGNFGGAGGTVATPTARPAPVAAPEPAAVIQPEPEPAPQPAPPPPVCKDVVRTLSDITFQTNSAELTPNARDVLDSVVNELRAASGDRVRVLAHTDSVGADAYNLDLSARRAQSVVNYLVEAGVDGTRLSSSGLGEMQPIASNETASGRAKNRRVELVWSAERCQ